MNNRLAYTPKIANSQIRDKGKRVLEILESKLGLPDSLHIVETTDGRVVRSGLDHLAIVACLFSDTFHHGDEVIKRILALGLGGLDHQCLMEEQREIYGGRMEAVIEETLCHVKRGDMAVIVMVATEFWTQTVENELMLAKPLNG